MLFRKREHKIGSEKEDVKNGTMVLHSEIKRIFTIHGSSPPLSKMMENMKITGQIQAQTDL